MIKNGWTIKQYDNGLLVSVIHNNYPDTLKASIFFAG